MERDSSRPRFKLVHVVMPRLWLKQIKKSYRRKRPGHVDGDGDYTTTSSCDTSFESSSSCHPHFRPIDAASRSLIDVAFPLSPMSAKRFPAVAMSPLRYPVSPSPASASSPSSRFYPSPCRYPPSPTRRALFPPRAIDIPYPISPRKPPVSLLHSPSPATRFLSGGQLRKVDALMPAPPSPPRFSTASAPDRSDYIRHPPPPVALLQRSRSARSSLFACFSDDFRLPESAARSEEAAPACLSRLGSTRGTSFRDFKHQVVPLTSSGHGAEEEKPGEPGARISCCACTPGCSEYGAACCSTSRETAAALSSSWRSSSGNYGKNLLSKSARHSSSTSSSSRGERPSNSTNTSTHHRRGLSLSCMSNAARNSSPDGQEPLASSSSASFASRQAAAKPAAGYWQRETSWSVLAELDNEVVRRRVVLRKRVGVNHGLHNSVYDPEASSSSCLEEGKRPPDAGFAEGVDNCCSFRLSTSSGDVNAEHNSVPWDKDFSSATSEDPESLFTSFEVDSACVTPRGAPSSSLTGFLISKARFPIPKVSEGWSGGEPSSAWPAPFIPEECEAACPSPEDSDPESAEEAESQLSERSDQASDMEEFDSSSSQAGSLSSSSNFDGTRQADCDLSEDDEEERAQSWDELEARPPSFLQNQDCEASFRLREACSELPQCRETADKARGLSEPWPDSCRMECYPSDTCGKQEEEDDTEKKAGGLGWTDGLQSLLEGRLFPSSEDEVAVLNEPDSNEEEQLVVSDESCDEKDRRYCGATTEGREAPYLRRKAPRCKRNHVSAGTMRIPLERKGLDRKPALKSEDSSKKKHNSHSTREAHALPAVDLPVEIRGRVRESVPVVTHSYDPYTDFRDSMVEMILEKDILDTQDLEELLHAYLALNKGEFHGLIVEVFTDLWYQIFEAESSRL